MVVFPWPDAGAEMKRAGHAMLPRANAVAIMDMDSDMSRFPTRTPVREINNGTTAVE